MNKRFRTNVEREEETRDLGFGSVVGGESHLRLLNRDGSFNVARRGLSFWSSLSLYHSLLTVRWAWFYAIVTLFLQRGGAYLER